MIIDFKKSEGVFKKEIDNRYFDFLKTRGILAADYMKALRARQYGFPVDNTVMIDDEEYSIRYFLGPSDEGIYDLIRDNQIYGIKPNEGTIFAVLLGDDFLFFMPNDNAVYFCLRDTEEITKVAPSYDAFINNTFYGEKHGNKE